VGEVEKGSNKATNELFECSFNTSIKVETRENKLTSDAGVLLSRELDDRLGFSKCLASKLQDRRDPDLVTHPLSELARTRILLIGQGWRDQDDADKLRDDPVLRLAVSDRRGDAPLRPSKVGEYKPNGLASQPTLSRLIDMLSSDHNLTVMRESLLDFTARQIAATRGHRFRSVHLDVDSTMFEVYGRQGGTARNGHYQCNGYHPLIAMLAETGTWVGAQIRSGEVWSATGAREFLLPLLDKVEAQVGQVASVRGDAAFANEEVMSALENRRNKTGHVAQVPYIFRLPTNPRLEALAEEHIKRPAGRPPEEPREWLVELAYQAGTWPEPRRVVLVVLERPGHLFLDYFFLVTNWSKEQQDAPAILDDYRQRGTMEAHLGELKSVLCPALSCSEREHAQRSRKPTEDEQAKADAHDSACNDVTMLMYMQAYNLMNLNRLMASEAMPRHIHATSGHVPAPIEQAPKSKTKAEIEDSGWSLKRLREQAMKVAARVLMSGRRVTIVIAGSAAEIWQRMWRRIARLQPVTI
jgi:hypothetical protein